MWRGRGGTEGKKEPLFNVSGKGEEKLVGLWCPLDSKKLIEGELVRPH